MVIIRPYNEETDKAFVYATMLRGLYYGSHSYTHIDKKLFFERYPAIIDEIVQHSEIRLAVLPDDENLIVGYCIYSKGTLHWAFVKKEARQLGVLNKMLEGVEINSISHLTQIGESVMIKKKWRYLPWLLYI